MREFVTEHSAQLLGIEQLEQRAAEYDDQLLGNEHQAGIRCEPALGMEDRNRELELKRLGRPSRSVKHLGMRRLLESIGRAEQVGTNLIDVLLPRSRGGEHLPDLSLLRTEVLHRVDVVGERSEVRGGAGRHPTKLPANARRPHLMRSARAPGHNRTSDVPSADP